METDIKRASVLIAGAGGSIGSSIAERVAEMSPARVILAEHDEFHLFSIWERLKERVEGTEIIPLLAKCDSQSFVEVCEQFKIDIVFNAAAYKHVGLSEMCAPIYFQNNIKSALNLQNLAANKGADYVLISTDKAVEPENVMGQSKRLCEIATLANANANGFSNKNLIVRFGNVLNSSGSVIPIFREQIRRGGPVTVTDKKATRYFMSISEATSLVIDCLQIGDQIGVYTLDMGSPINIYSLACNMIEQAGYGVSHSNPGPNEVELKLIGLRKGEKLSEKLSYTDLVSTQNPAIKKAQERTAFSAANLTFAQAIADGEEPELLQDFDWECGLA
ncbi:polysaccharide biosynthesis protein [Luminiphilus sp.]|nr:polysaccharide biosynthesis protein [Luminiphilus sp.]